ncbi:MAG: hypothetical protein L0312_03385 [Acidobacteria bacterium]|nr:hypothetical protein [Acidobacteriota bacterium]
MLIILILATAFLLPSIAQAIQGPVQVRYTIDASQPAKRPLQIQARIEGLPEGRTTILFPESKSSNTAGLERISHAGRLAEDGEVVALLLEGGRAIIESSGVEPVNLVYQLRSESFAHLDQATYLDETRCLFHPQDVLLQIESQGPKAAVSFLLPSHWQVVSAASSAPDGLFSIETKRPAPFYLGRAESAQDNGSAGPLRLAIERGWPPAQELLESLRRQIKYRQKFARNQRPKALLGVFLGPGQPVQSKEPLAFGTPQVVAFATMTGLAESPSARSKIQRVVARSLVRAYLPALGTFSAALSPDLLTEYLTLKACLKTGVMGRAEFLDAMAVELWNSFGQSDERAVKPRTMTKPARTVLVSQPRSRCSGLLLDLALSFYGNSVRSLDAFLATGFPDPAPEPIAEADLRKRLRQEEQAASALAAVWQDGDLQKIGELLRPFGLLFDRRELPSFDFQLNETFQVAQMNESSQRGSLAVETGDRIVAINNHRLLLPDDLLKCRSRLAPGQEVQLDLERRNLPLRVTQRVAREVVLKLEINRLADFDKQEKLAQFLSAEVEQN